MSWISVAIVLALVPAWRPSDLLADRHEERQRRREAQQHLEVVLEQHQNDCPRARHYAIHIYDWSHHAPLRQSHVYEDVRQWFLDTVVVRCDSVPYPARCEGVRESQFLLAHCLQDYHADDDPKRDDMYCFTHAPYLSCRGLTASECTGRLVPSP